MQQDKQTIIKRIKSLMRLYGLTTEDISDNQIKTGLTPLKSNDDDNFGGYKVDPTFFERYKDSEASAVEEDLSMPSTQNQDLTDNMSDVNMNIDESLVDDDFGGK